MLAVKGTRITSDEEERVRRGYNISTHYEMGDIIDKYEIVGSDVGKIEIQYEHQDLSSVSLSYPYC